MAHSAARAAGEVPGAAGAAVNRRLAEGVGGIVAFLAVWEGLVSGGLVQYDYLPAPSAIARGLLEIVASGTLGEELAHTLAAALGGWAIATAAGILGGAWLGLSARARRYTLASIEVLRPLPAVAFVPVALLLFGFSVQMVLFVIVAPALWPALVNTMSGFAGVPARLHDVARVLHLGRARVLGQILLPAAAESVLVGCRLSMSLALVMAIVAEMVGSPMGLGYALVREQQAMHPDRMFGYVFLIGLLGIVLNGLLVGLSRVLLPGQFKRAAAAWSGAR
jgi:ABC-type nitrate/sulfonate/bicarbonate transport system permease component